MPAGLAAVHRKTEELPWWPIWSMEFGATYPYEETTPYAIGTRGLEPYQGSHGIPLATMRPGERMEALPSHARVEEKRFPHWKVNFIRWNRELYERNRGWIDRWRPDILQFPPSLQKLEWNCKGEERDIWRYIVQIRELPAAPTPAYRALGNAVNVDVVEKVAGALLKAVHGRESAGRRGCVA